MTRPTETPLLVIEDSDEDFEILQLLMEDMGVCCPICRCDTGDRALEMISQYKARPRLEDDHWPAVILLDLNLPGIDGREILTYLKQDDQLQEIPVVVFTTSSDPKDIRNCYRNGANGYLIKPVDTQQLEEKIQAFVDYWLSANSTSNWKKVNLVGS